LVEKVIIVLQADIAPTSNFDSFQQPKDFVGKRRINFRHGCAHMGLEDDKAFCLQLRQCLANGDGADPQLHSQVVNHQTLATGQRAGNDGIAQPGIGSFAFATIMDRGRVQLFTHKAGSFRTNFLRYIL
jgi:hypothetical protein